MGEIVKTCQNTKELEQLLTLIDKFFREATAEHFVEVLNDLNYSFIAHSIDDEDGPCKSHIKDTIWTSNIKINFILELQNKWENLKNIAA